MNETSFFILCSQCENRMHLSTIFDLSAPERWGEVNPVTKASMSDSCSFVYRVFPAESLYDFLTVFSSSSDFMLEWEVILAAGQTTSYIVLCTVYDEETRCEKLGKTDEG